MYKAVVIKYSPKAKEIAVRVEKTANKITGETGALNEVPALSRPLPKASWDLENPVNRLQKVSLSCYKEKST